jgi:hypothetical protein
MVLLQIAGAVLEQTAVINSAYYPLSRGGKSLGIGTVGVWHCQLGNLLAGPQPTPTLFQPTSKPLLLHFSSPIQLLFPPPHLVF